MMFHYLAQLLSHFCQPYISPSKTGRIMEQQKSKSTQPNSTIQADVPPSIQLATYWIINWNKNFLDANEEKDLLPTVQLRDGGRQLVQLTPVLPEPRRVVRHDCLVHALLPRLYWRLWKAELKFKFRAFTSQIPRRSSLDESRFQFFSCFRNRIENRQKADNVTSDPDPGPES